MTEKIRVLIVDDIPETRENVRKLLQFEPDMEVIGQAGNGEQAIEMAKEHRPDIVLMDINMPGVDGISASKAISQAVPSAQTIIMSVQSESDYIRKAMLAGARDFLMKPFSGDEISVAIRRVHETRPKITAASPVQPGHAATAAAAVPADVRTCNTVAVFSPKGGSGCTTIAINVAVSLAQQGKNTLLIDGSLQFGDVAVMLNLRPVSTIADLTDRLTEVDADLLTSVVLTHESGVKVLAAPPRPEMAELVEVEEVLQLIEYLKQLYEYIVIDTSSNLNDMTLALLDVADRILLVTQQSVPSLKNVSRFFDITEELDYRPDKIKLVINRASSKVGVPIKTISDTLKRPVVATIPVDDALVSTSVDQGTPLVLGATERRSVSQAIIKMTTQIVDDLSSDDDNGFDGQDDPSKKKSSRLSRLFGGGD